MFLPPAGCPNNYELRLAESLEGDENEGRIEFCLNGEWRILCQNGVDIPDITVMCRELGYEPISTSLYNTSSLLKKACVPVRVQRSTAEPEPDLLTCYSHLEDRMDSLL